MKMLTVVIYQQNQVIIGLSLMPLMYAKSLPYEDVLKFVEHIQRIKDIYNEGNKEILNYGTLCDLCIEGWNLVK